MAQLAKFGYVIPTSGLLAKRLNSGGKSIITVAHSGMSSEVWNVKSILAFGSPFCFLLRTSEYFEKVLGCGVV